ncbi:hypothetical protein O181_019072 [Austropuccinia psidii MF-1]|uniref:Reverse transcriptase Ty1/copia-type domain-containing protein n=1 Tax=Austropuccinia psidii MF-1 TaxID=1389203 RepID=A0A9Q3CAT2_9BASI|nr:hypothetical protein [Austropuccinia psidii MF-1]
MEIFGKNIQPFKKQIHKEFRNKDTGPADLLLGVKIQHLEEGITLDQQHFVDSLLDLYRMANCKAVSMLLVPNEHMGAATKDEEKAFKSIKFNLRSSVGSINYLSMASCPDLSHTVSSLSPHLQRPGIPHGRAFLKVLKYLHGTQEMGILYNQKGSPGLITFSNADWGNCHITQQATSGFLAQLHGFLVFCKRMKQPCVSISTAETEY